MNMYLVKDLPLWMLYSDYDNIREQINKYGVLTATETDDELAEYYASKWHQYTDLEPLYIGEIERRADLIPTEILMQWIERAK